MKHIILLAAALFLSQCADKAESNKLASEASKPRSMNDRFNGKGKEGYYQDAEGNWKIQNDKRSSFEGMGQSTLANREFAGKAYTPASVNKKSWWGNTEHSKQAYTGNTTTTQFNKSPNDAAKNAQEGGFRSLFSRKSVNTPRIASQTARESSTSGIARPRATQNESQRSSMEQADIIDWKEQRAMDVQDTKSWLKK